MLGTLLHLLDMPFGTIDGEERGVIYVWPAAFTYGTWEDIPADDVEQLRAIYTDQDLDLLADYGEYIGWRTGMTRTESGSTLSAATNRSRVKGRG